MTPTAPERTIEYLPLNGFVPSPRNAKTHALGSIKSSIQTFGYTVPILLDERTNRTVVAGHGRLDALRDLKARGAAPPDGITEQDGEWLVPAVTGWASRDDDHAAAVLIADNRLTEKGRWDDRMLAEVLDDLADYSPDLLNVTGYNKDDLDRLIAAASSSDDDDETPGRSSGPVTKRCPSCGYTWTVGEEEDED